MGDSYDTPGLTGRAWFRPAVAAWFALLLGGGLWLMPPSVHASMAGTLGLGAVPNNVAILCAGLALLGFLLGWVIASRIAAATGPRAFAPGFEGFGGDGWDDGEAEEEMPRRRRVFSAREDIGEEGIAISAPRDEDERRYEEEFSVEDIAPVTPEEDFEAVYAEMEPGYFPSQDAGPVEVEAAGIDEPAEYEAEYAEVEEAEYEPVEVEPEPEYAAAPQYAPEPEHELEPADYEEAAAEARAPETPLGDMSLDALLGRLEGAMEAHKAMVATSERAAAEPAPQAVPMARELGPVDEDDLGLAEVSDDDPVIAFLRREASRRMPQRPANEDAAPEVADIPEQPRSHEGQTEAQAALRNALDRLGQAGRKD
ncbi:hypothetical protein [Qipengyuania sphaerica]|uniref:hypothetical protein n=1 Tax=Qipengyuania sphaerica TaxID=2867243 RepID=UPI001C88DDF8|nr:hypothetical protein [Qipengyuania sphaerica]MBX7541688.1 hypothetical protein [Qipengyuania sphaerica]